MQPPRRRRHSILPANAAEVTHQSGKATSGLCRTRNQTAVRPIPQEVQEIAGGRDRRAFANGPDESPLQFVVDLFWCRHFFLGCYFV
jgi:hypothetical protein